MPNYVITDSGPDHDKRFHAIVRLGKDEIAEGTGSSKKMAEMAAALEAWTILSGSGESTSATSAAATSSSTDTP